MIILFDFKEYLKTPERKKCNKIRSHSNVQKRVNVFQDVKKKKKTTIKNYDRERRRIIKEYHDGFLERPIYIYLLKKLSRAYLLQKVSNTLPSQTLS